MPGLTTTSGGGAAKVSGISAADLDLFPVEQVSIEDIDEFLRRLNARETGREWVYRLPTEEEWEYSCRGPVPSPASGQAQAHCGFSFYLAKPTNATNENTKLTMPRVRRPPLMLVIFKVTFHKSMFK